MPNAARFLLLVVLVLASCDLPPSETLFPRLTYQHLPPLQFDVRELEVVQDYDPPLQVPNVEHRFQVKPAETAAQWAYDRLRPAGASRRMRFRIVDASVVEVALPVKEGLEGAFVVEQSERYEARFKVRVEIIGDDGRLEGTTTAEAERSITVPEDASLSDRERTWFRLTEATMNDLNAELEGTLPRVFGRYYLH